MAASSRNSVDPIALRISTRSGAGIPALGHTLRQRTAGSAYKNKQMELLAARIGTTIK